MKKMHLFLSLALCAGSLTLSYGQEDIKEWKHKLKQLTPEQYKQLVAENEHLKNEASSKNAQIAQLEKELAETAEKPKVETVVSPTSGIVYKVQIGSFKNKHLAVYLNEHKNFSGDTDEDGTRKYTLGEFKDYWEADNFKKYLREMGVKDAWIVSYKNGKRVAIKDALEGAL